MSRTKFIPFAGKRILEMDFTDVQDTDEAIRHIEDAKAVVSSQPKNSLLVLVNVTGSRFNTRIANALRELAAHDRPYVIASAVVGIEGLMNIVLKTVSRATGRSFKLFGSEELAKEWLIEQGQ